MGQQQTTVLFGSGGGVLLQDMLAELARWRQFADPGIEQVVKQFDAAALDHQFAVKQNAGVAAGLIIDTDFVIAVQVVTRKLGKFHHRLLYLSIGAEVIVIDGDIVLPLLRPFTWRPAFGTDNQLHTFGSVRREDGVRVLFRSGQIKTGNIVFAGQVVIGSAAVEYQFCGL